MSQIVETSLCSTPWPPQKERWLYLAGHVKVELVLGYEVGAVHSWTSGLLVLIVKGWFDGGYLLVEIISLRNCDVVSGFTLGNTVPQPHNLPTPPMKLVQVMHAWKPFDKWSALVEREAQIVRYWECENMRGWTFDSLKYIPVGIYKTQSKLW